MTRPISFNEHLFKNPHLFGNFFFVCAVDRPADAIPTTPGALADHYWATDHRQVGNHCFIPIEKLVLSKAVLRFP